MPSPADHDRIAYIIDLVELIGSELDGITRDEFLNTKRVHDLAAYRLGTVGETARRLSDNVKAAHPEVPWQSVYAFRNIVVHDYRAIDPKRVWVIATEDLPDLAAACQSLRDALGEP